MSSWLAFTVLVLAWALAPLVIRPILLRTDLPASSVALTAIAVMACFAASLNGVTPPLALSTAAVGKGYHTTYYVFSRVLWLQLEAFLLIDVGGFAKLVQGLAGEGRLSRVAVSGHWAFHVGAGLTIAQALRFMPVDTPRRYVDYPQAFYWWNMTANAGSKLCLAGAILIGGAFLISLARLILRR